jgi:hypothetical protein
MSKLLARLSFAMLLTGCVLASPRPIPITDNERELERCLPCPYSLSTYVEMGDGRVGSMHERLSQLRAIPGPDGKIVDGISGREICFWKRPQWGTPPPLDRQTSQAQELSELQLKYTVVIIGRDPREPLPS